MRRKAKKPSPAQVHVLRLMQLGHSLSVPTSSFEGAPYIRADDSFITVHGNTVAAMRDRAWIEQSSSSMFSNHWTLTTLGHRVAWECAG